VFTQSTGRTLTSLAACVVDWSLHPHGEETQKMAARGNNKKTFQNSGGSRIFREGGVTLGTRRELERGLGLRENFMHSLIRTWT